MTVEHRCPECGHIFDSGWITSQESIEHLHDGEYYQYCYVDCDCGMHLLFTSYFKLEEVDVEVEE